MEASEEMQSSRSNFLIEGVCEAAAPARC